MPWGKRVSLCERDRERERERERERDRERERVRSKFRSEHNLKAELITTLEYGGR